MDDLIFWSQNESEIDDITHVLISAGVDLEKEVDAAGFLGVGMECDGETGMLELKQTDLDDRIIESLGFDVRN